MALGSSELKWVSTELKEIPGYEGANQRFSPEPEGPIAGMGGLSVESNRKSGEPTSDTMNWNSSDWVVVADLKCSC